MAKILIVDDDPDVVDAAQTVLESVGYQVASASDKTSGMKAVDSEQPDLVLLDVMMNEPDDGIAMAQDLRRAGWKKPILMMSSISKVTGMEYGKDNEVTPVDDFVEKPVKPSDLVEKVKALLK
ncbi:MAG: response regulator [Sedimentisphaerales bacterium]|nr:response regulator [Sedimentisphaerales bacterium]